MPAWLWFWLPVAFFIILPAAWMLLPPDVYNLIFANEIGPVETTTALLLLAASILAFRTTGAFWRMGKRGLALLLALFALAAFWLAGEELSWGQHFLGFQTPEELRARNLQGEFNLHNLESFKEPKKILKWIVVLGIGIGGGLLPLIARWKGWKWQPRKHDLFWLLPTGVCIPASLAALVLHLGYKLARWIDRSAEEGIAGFFLNVHEATEFYIALFAFLYTLSLVVRLKRRDESAESVGP